MAGLGEAASVIAVLQISREILSLCWEYLSACSTAEKDIKRLRDEITALHDVLKNVKELLEDSKATKLRGSKLLVEQLKKCSSELEDLKNTLDPSQTRNALRRLGPRALKWPFQREGVQKKITMLNGYKATFNFALTTDQA
jgi:predicted  nucleic acid-binding Zn-ribbon protein